MYNICKSKYLQENTYKKFDWQSLQFSIASNQNFLFGPANGEYRRPTIRNFCSFPDPFNRFTG